MKSFTRILLLVLTALVVGKFYFQLPCFAAAAAAQNEGNILQRARRDCNSCGQECSVLCRVPDRRWKFCCMNYVRKKRGYFNPFSLRTLENLNFPSWSIQDNYWDPAKSDLSSASILPDSNSHLNYQNSGRFGAFHSFPVISPVGKFPDKTTADGTSDGGPPAGFQED